MELRLHSKESIRHNVFDERVFVDVRCLENEAGILAQFYSSMHIVEVRKKERYIITISYQSHEYRKECDLGFWADSEIIWKSYE